MRPAPGRRPALLMAWREAKRARGRSALVLVMIALPVLGVVAADVVITTVQVSGVEALDRRLGAADAAVTVEAGVTGVVHGFDPDATLAATQTRPAAAAPTLAEVRAVLGRDVPTVRRSSGEVQVRTEAGVAHVDVLVTDLADPLAQGLFRLGEGRYPERDDEVVVNPALAERGFSVGASLQTESASEAASQFQTGSGETYRVVGVGESTTIRSRPMLVGLSPTLPRPGRRR